MKGFIIFLLIVVAPIYLLDRFHYCYSKSKFMTPKSAVQKKYLMKSLVAKSKRSSEIPIISMIELEKYLHKYPDSFSSSYTDDFAGRFMGRIRYFYPISVAKKNAKDKNLSKIITGTYHIEVFGKCGNYEGARSFDEDHIYINNFTDKKYNPYQQYKKNIGEKNEY